MNSDRLDYLLRTRKPLSDPLLVVTRVLWLMLIVGIIASVLALAAALQTTDDTVGWGLLGPALAFFGGAVPWILFWLSFCPHRRTNVLYLRAFRNDEETAWVRAEIQNAMGWGYRISGIRDPRRRFSFLHYVGLGFLILRYATPKYLNLEAGSDWKQRLWRTLADIKYVVIDVRDVTPGAEFEVQMVSDAIGVRGVLFVVDESKTPAEWEALIRSLLAPEERSKPLWIASWNRFKKEFRQKVREFRDSLPSCQWRPKIAALQAIEKEPSPAPSDVYLHDGRFVAGLVGTMVMGYVISLLLLLLFPLETAAALHGTITFMIALITIPLLIWALLMYLIECGSYKRRAIALAAFGLATFWSLTMLAGVENAREAARRIKCINQLKQIALALHDYVDNSRSLPSPQAAGHWWERDQFTEPLYSGRVRLLETMNEYDSLLLRFDYRAAWNAIGPNAEISSKEVAMFVCPSRRTGGKAESDFFFPVGPDFAFQEGVNSTQRNIFGLSGTIVMYEASNQGIRWAEPRDPLLNSKSPRLPPSHHEGSTNVVLGDGSIRSISADIDPEVLSKLLRPTMDR